MTDHDLIRFTWHEVELLHKLLFSDKFMPGSKESIARFLEGKETSTTTRRFVERLINLSCLTYLETKKVKIMQEWQERPVYDRDKKKIVQIWEQTAYYHFTYKIMDEIEERVLE